jgi:3-isopropylmalate dehydrogenase
LEEHPVGHASLQQFGATVRPGLLETVQSADGLILGPTATADFRDERDGEINPSRFFRKNLDLFANVRPARTYPGLRNRFGAFDLVVVRENTEGFYADRNMEQGNSELLLRPMWLFRSAASRDIAASGLRKRPAGLRCAAASISPSFTRPMC